jgi:hypothetical protein
MGAERFPIYRFPIYLFTLLYLILEYSTPLLYISTLLETNSFPHLSQRHFIPLFKAVLVPVCLYIMRADENPPKKFEEVANTPFPPPFFCLPRKKKKE